MAKATKAKQLTFSLATRVGLLSEISAAIADAKVNVQSLCAYEAEKKAYFMLTADSVAKTKKAIAKFGADIKEKDVLCVEMANKPGELLKVAKKLGDAGINIIETYGSTGAGKSSTCIFYTADINKAMRIINKQ